MIDHTPGMFRTYGTLGLAFGALLAISNLSLAADASLKAATDSLGPPPNFAKDVVPIFQEKCQDCHHSGSMAPMSLVTYAETRPWAKAIKERVLTRQMPPWHIDKTVGVQRFKNDISLTDGQIQTIVRWVDAGAPAGSANDMPPPKQWSDDSEWKAAKQLGRPDLVISSEPYTMPAHHQDVWWRPLSDVPIAEPRWLRAVEMRPGKLAGRKITHHAVAYLAQDDQGSIDPGGIANLRGRGMLMEWAIGKSFDLYHPNTGKLLVPGAQISWDIHLHAVGEEIRDHVEIGLWFYPKGQEPKYRTYLTPFQAAPGLRVKKQLDIPPNSIVQTQGFTVLKQAAWLENFQPHNAPARQSDGRGGNSAGRHHAGNQLCRQVQLQLDDELHLCGRRGSCASEGHSHPCYGLVRQHER